MVGFIELFDTARDYTLQFTTTHTLVSTVTSSLAELSPASAASFLEQPLTTTEPQQSSI
jgi:hypothetical protein